MLFLWCLRLSSTNKCLFTYLLTYLNNTTKTQQLKLEPGQILGLTYSPVTRPDPAKFVDPVSRDPETRFQLRYQLRFILCVRVWDFAIVQWAVSWDFCEFVWPTTMKTNIGCSGTDCLSISRPRRGAVILCGLMRPRYYVHVTVVCNQFRCDVELASPEHRRQSSGTNWKYAE